MLKEIRRAGLGCCVLLLAGCCLRGQAIAAQLGTSSDTACQIPGVACPGGGTSAPASEPAGHVRQGLPDTGRPPKEGTFSSAPLEQAPAPPPPSTVAVEKSGQPPSATAAPKLPPAPATATVPGEPLASSRANPYHDVPSLYDLYTQLSSPSAELERFGAAIFRNGSGNLESLPMDMPAGPDYVLGVGDGLNIDVWGSVSDRLQRVVDREGQISVPEVGTIPAAGRTLEETQRGLEQLLRSRFRNVQVSLSLARLRTVRVYVVGDVERPGAYDISSLSTPLNALYAAGGPTARGSLRVARHYRGQRLVEEVDLYELILRGLRPELARLEPGDTVLVPPARNEVAVTGMVRRPAIYELREERSLAQLLALAGGVLPTGTLRRIEVERVVAHQKRTMLNLELPQDLDDSAAARRVEEFTVQDGDRVRISPILAYSEKTVFLTGHVARPGKYSFREGMTAADLVAGQELLPEPAEHGELVRLVPPDYRPAVIAFAVQPREGRVEPIPLAPFDTVRFFGRFDFEDAPTVTVRGEVRSPGDHRLSGETRLRDAVYLAGGLTLDASGERAHVYRKLPGSQVRVFSVPLSAAMAGDADANLPLQSRDTVVIHSNLGKVDPPKVYIHGEVAQPGAYPLADGLTAAELVRLAGGFTRGAYRERADLSRYTVVDGEKVVGDHRELALARALNGDREADVLLQDADVLSVRRLVGWSDVGAAVEISGEVQHPGTYGIREGERLSSLLERAGGFTSLAFAQAAVLERVQVREMAEKSRRELVERLQAQPAEQFSAKTTAEERAAMAETMRLERQQALERLRGAPVSGRLVIAISNQPEKWADTPADLELRPGDTLRVPKKPQFVLISGEVYNPTAINYAPGRPAEWYLEKAGGPTEFANKKGAFILRADGSVVGRGGDGFWGGGALGQRMQPGDSIIVPQKIRGGSDTWKHMLDTAQFMASLAIAARAAAGF